MSKLNQPKSNVLLPEIHHSKHAEPEIDLSVLDVMGIEEFMTFLKTRSDKNHQTLLEASQLLATQCKSLRNIMSMSSQLFNDTNDVKTYSKKILDLVGSSLNVERIVVLKYDFNENILVVDFTNESVLQNCKIPIENTLEGDVFRSGQHRKISDVKKGKFDLFVDTIIDKPSRQALFSPILIDGKVHGIIQTSHKSPTAINNHSPRSSTNRRRSLTALDTTYIPFTNQDEMYLDYIAILVGFMWKSSDTPISTRDPSSKLQSVLSNISAGADYDSFLNWIINEAHKRLDADRVSLFTYNDKINKLECKVSQDIKGQSISIDSGIAGLVFKSLQVVNIVDAKADARHYNEFDKNLGYQTRTLLCAPLVDDDGHPIGVIQAINKRSGTGFTLGDIEQIASVCKQTTELLKRKEKSIRETTNDNLSLFNNSGSILTDSVSSIMEANTINELAHKVESLATTWANCDFASIYTLQLQNGIGYIKALRKTSTVAKNYISSPISSQSESFEKQVPNDIITACTSNTSIEIEIQTKNGVIEPYVSDYPKCSRILIYPINIPANSSHSTTTYTFLLLGRLVSNSAFSELTKSNLNILKQVVEKSATILLNRKDNNNHYVNNITNPLSNLTTHSSSDNLPVTDSNQQLIVKRVLNQVNDLIIIFNPSGFIIGCNKSLDLYIDISDNRIVQIFSKLNLNNNLFLDSNVDIFYQKLFKAYPLIVSDISSLLTPDTTRYIQRSNIEIKSKQLADYVVQCIYDDRNSNSIGIVMILSIKDNKESKQMSTSIPINSSISVNPLNLASITPLEVLDNIKSLVRTIEKAYDKDNDVLTSLNSMNVAVDTTYDLIHSHDVMIYPNKISKTPSLVSSSSKFGSRIAASMKLTNSTPTFHNHSVNPSPLGAQVHSMPMLASNDQSNVVTPVSLSRLPSRSTPPPQPIHDQPSHTYAPVGIKFNNLVSNDIGLPSNDELFSFSFNALEYKDIAILRNIVGKLFSALFNFKDINIDPNVLCNYIYEVSNNYHPNPFHNFHHATTTVHFSYMLVTTINAEEYLSNHQIFGIVLSALCHDVDHPGNTNLFEIHTESILALRYNDKSVLENHHCSVAFQLMKKPSCNVFGNYSTALSSELRKIMIECILATDMSVHFMLIDEIKTKISDDCDFHDHNDKIFLSKILLHASDLSNPVRLFHISQAWARNISEEFNHQVALEQSLDLPVLGFMMTTDEKSFCNNESGFAKFVVAPMWRNLAILFHQLDPLIQQLDSNLINWQKLLDEITLQEENDI
mmetsp:Transcript_15738/g.14240  ORF Transcript_15738/g.14240 Transcript_15738/m.14240 type:complete len:1270 (+) Transcript_15738:88-3897(+)